MKMKAMVLKLPIEDEVQMLHMYNYDNKRPQATTFIVSELNAVLIIFGLEAGEI